MARVVATRELLAPRADVWKFLAEPFHLSDWWPGVRGVRPDRHGLARGARWQVTADARTGGFVGTFLRRPETTQTVAVVEVREGQLLRLLFAGDGIEAEVRLEPAANGHTRVMLALEGPLLRLSRSLPRRALNRLYALCQTAAEL